MLVNLAQCMTLFILNAHFQHTIFGENCNQTTDLSMFVSFRRSLLGIDTLLVPEEGTTTMIGMILMVTETEAGI